MNNLTKTNVTHIKGYKKVSALILYFVLVMVIALSGLLVGTNRNTRIAYAMGDPPMVAQSVTYGGGASTNFGMPTAFQHNFVISHTAGSNPFLYTLHHNGALVGVNFTSIYHPAHGNEGTNLTVQVNPAAGIPQPQASSITAAINNRLTTTTATSNISVQFNNINLARNDFVRFTGTGRWVYTGSVTGNLSNNNVLGLVSLGSTATATVTRVWFNNFHIENQGSSRFAVDDPRFVAAPNQHQGVLGSARAHGVDVDANISLFVVGNSSIRATNEAQLSLRRNVLTNTEFSGHGLGRFAEITGRDAGRNQTISILEANIDSYNRFLHDWLATAYGAEITYLDYPNPALTHPATYEFINNIDPTGGSRGFQTRYNFHSQPGRTIRDWLNSGDFISDFVSSVSGPVGSRTFIISGANHQTGNAIRFNSTGGLVIDTTGEISSFAGGVTTGAGQHFSTIRMAANNFTNPFGNRTRLYIRNGDIRNRAFDISYSTGHNLTALGTSHMPTTAAAQGILVGAVIRSDHGILNANRTFGNDLLAGGTFTSASVVYETPNSAVANPGGSNLTVGNPSGGPGPVMNTGIAHDGNVIVFNNALSLTTNPLLFPSAMFTLGSQSLLMDGNTDRRISVVFLNGTFTAHRNMFLSDTATNGSAFDVHLMGGNFRTGEIPMLLTGSLAFIRNQGGNNLTGVRRGNTLTIYGQETIPTFNAGSINTQGASIVVNAMQTPVGATGIAGGVLLFASSAHADGDDNSDLPLFNIRGGTIENTSIALNAAPLIHVFQGDAGRAGYIRAGEFESPVGSFVIISRSANDVVMTGGRFENTGDSNSHPIIVGTPIMAPGAGTGINNYILGISANDSINPALNGAMFLNGGDIISQSNLPNRGLVHATKSNNTQAVVMGWDRNGNRTPNVTRLTNFGNSPMISVVESMTHQLPPAQGSEFTFTTSNSKIIIDRIDFNYADRVTGNPIAQTGHSILAVPHRYPEFQDRRHFPTLYFTGSLMGLQNNGGVSGLSAGFIRAALNTVELSDTFDNAGWIQGTHAPFNLLIENLNHEISINQFVIKNIGTHLPAFNIRGYNTPVNLSVLPTWANSQGFLPELTGVRNHVEATATEASYARDKRIVNGDLRIVNLLDVGFFTSRYDSTFNRDPQGSGIVFPESNIPSGYAGYLWDNRPAVSNMTYGDVLAGFSGNVFTTGSSIGLPRLELIGYTHIGWTYTGYLSPRNLMINSGAGNNIVITQGRERLLLEDVFISASTELRSAFSHMLTAVWVMTEPILNEEIIAPNRVQDTNTVSGFNAALTTITETTGLTTVTRTFDGNPLTFSIDPQHAALGLSGTRVYIEWLRSVDGVWDEEAIEITNTDPLNGPAINGFSLTNLTDVWDTGWYRVTITLYDDIGMRSSNTHTFHITITRQTLTEANITMPTVEFDGNMHSVLNPGSHAIGEFSVIDNYGRNITTRVGTSGSLRGTADFWVTPDLATEYFSVADYTFTFFFLHNYDGIAEKLFIIYAAPPYVTFENFRPTAYSHAAATVVPMRLRWVSNDPLDGFRYPTIAEGWPTLSVPGYTFEGWFTTNNLEAVAGGEPRMAGDHTLIARWSLNQATGTTIVGDSWDSNTNTFGFVFDRELHYITAVGLVPNAIANPSLHPNAISYTYFWHRGASGTAILSVGERLSLFEVETETFRLRVVAADSEGRQSEFWFTFNVNITRHEITEVILPSQNWTGNILQPIITIMHGTYRLMEGIDFTITPPASEVRNAGIYNFTFNFIGNYTGQVTATFEVVMATRLFLGNLQPALSPVPASFVASSARWDNVLNMWYVFPNANGTYPTLPTPDTTVTGFRGYTFSGWNFGISAVVPGTPLNMVVDHQLIAVWTLIDPVVTLSGTDFNSTTNTLAFIFDRNFRTITASATVDGTNENLAFLFTWRSGSTTGPIVDSSNQRSFTNVLQSGTYFLTVTAEDAQGNRSTSNPIEVIISITPRNIADSSISVNIPQGIYSGSFINANVFVTHTVNSVAHQLLPGVEFSFTPNGATAVGTHVITISGVGPNYTGTRNANFVIAHATVTISFINLQPALSPVAAQMPAITSTDGLYQGLTAPTLPVGFIGYEFIGWSFGGMIIENGDNLVALFDHSLAAVWRIVEPVIAPIADLNVTFNGNYHTLTATIANTLPGAVYTFAWYRVGTSGGSDVRVGEGASLNLRNVENSGLYFVVATVTDNVIASRSATSSNISIQILEAQLVAPAITRNNNILSWNPVSNATGYEISVSEVNGGVWTPITSFIYSNGVFTYDITSYLRPITNQAFRVRAISTDSNRATSEPSNTISYRHLPPPSAPVIARDGTTNNILWDAVYLNFIDGGSVGYATNYRIYRNGEFIGTAGPGGWVRNHVGAPESFDVGPFLVAGNNRITVTAVFQADWWTPWSEHSNHIDIYLAHVYTVVFMNGSVEFDRESNLTQTQLNTLLSNLPEGPADTNTHRFAGWELVNQVTDVNITTITFRVTWELLPDAPTYTVIFMNGLVEHSRVAGLTTLSGIVMPILGDT
ncbi:MAG: hypothetical protein FWE13_06100, partial [Firmicutes bacterium]|nr:hypothetical protein [Bacillota bacterium]